MFNPFLNPICFNSLDHVAPSTWIGHAPFALFLTDILRPATIVELGTYYGTSYCAFCQAVEQLNFAAKCYAIDTWQGDSQSGFFGDEVLNDLRSYHDEKYGRFSRLIQSTFDEALAHFEDESIDLLHIDGFHTYEEVKNDYEKWLPKMSERAVVLFHDINVREKDFGVWRFWREIKSQHPNFEFIHSHGLGILAVGSQCRTEFLDFLSCANENSARTQNFFYQLGLRFEAKLEIRHLRQSLRETSLDEQQPQEENLRLIEILEAEQRLQAKSELLTVQERELQEREFNFQSQVKAVDERRDVERTAEELEEALSDLANERSAVERQRKKLSTESQHVFAEKLELQTILLRLNQNYSADEIIRSLGAKLDAAKTSSETQILKLIIGIVTYDNSDEQISQLINSVKLATDHITELNIKTEVFVIDNGRETICCDSDLPITKFRSLGNVGFGQGMNHLMTQAFSDRQVQWYLCLNPDGVMHYRALDELLKVAKLDPHSLLEARQFPEEHLKKYDNRTLETTWASGACLLISKQIYEEIGGFDPHFFMYLEDVDFSWRARAAGFKIKFIPKSLFGHRVLERPFNEKTDRCQLLSGRYLALKWKNEEFQKWTEYELVNRGYYPSLSELPELPEPPSEENSKTDVSDFNYHFYFSPPRW